MTSQHHCALRINPIQQRHPRIQRRFGKGAGVVERGAPDNGVGVLRLPLFPEACFGGQLRRVLEGR
ncbi:MAG: hypothetical protein J7457_02050 [Roseiflexus sp.]|nr:hypothetical protein [Roseiflexus sp.]